MVDGKLEPTERTRVEQHLAGCGTCPALDAPIVGVSGALAALRDPDSVVPEELAIRVRSAVERT